MRLLRSPQLFLTWLACPPRICTGSSGQVSEEDGTSTEAGDKDSAESKRNKTEPCEPVVRVEGQSPGEPGRNAITTEKGCVLSICLLENFSCFC